MDNRSNTGFQGEPLGMVVAYVDDLIGIGQQDQLDGMKASLDALYTRKLLEQFQHNIRQELNR